MLRYVAYRCIVVLTVLLIAAASTAAFAGTSADVEKILRDIRQDRPVPACGYLQQAEPMNTDCLLYRGNYNGISITVETHPNSDSVASVLLQISGPDRTRQILPAVRRVIGPPRYSRPKESRYGWEWPEFRTGSLHYAKGAGPGTGFTIVSLFYR